MIRRRAPIMILTAGTAILTAILIAGWPTGLRINMTPSYPRGLWRIETLDRPVAVGDLVFICPPVTAAAALVGVIAWSGDVLALPLALAFPALWAAARSR